MMEEKADGAIPIGPSSHLHFAIDWRSETQNNHLQYNLLYIFSF